MLTSTRPGSLCVPVFPFAKLIVLHLDSFYTSKTEIYASVYILFVAKIIQLDLIISFVHCQN